MSVHVTVYCVCVCALEVLSFLICSTLIKALAILSWLPLITDTAWALPGLLCFPQSHWRITAECLLLRLLGYQAQAILTGQTSNTVFSWPIYPPVKKKKVGGNHKTFYPCVKSICLPKCSCRHTVNASSLSSLFYSLGCDWCAGRVVIDRLTGMHNVTRGKAHSTFFSHLADTIQNYFE